MSNIPSGTISQEPRVLIVDDIHENIQILVHLLSNKGLKISFADSGVKALKAISTNLPDLILLDVSMPEMDGFEVCKSLKEDHLTKDIPVIFITARIDQEDIVKGLAAGAVDYVTKPFNGKELLSRIHTHLELKKAQDAIKEKNKELFALNEVKNQLFSVISHDMKNLFNNILFGTESMEKEIDFFDKKEIAQMAGMLNDSSKRAYNLLQNLLDWSRSQMNTIQIHPVAVELRMVINHTLKLLKPSADKKKIHFKDNYEGDMFLAFADMEMTKSMLRNLIMNCIKFSHENSIIRIRVKEKPNSIYIEIEDQGVGMKPEVIENLRNAMNPYTTPGTKNEKGSGLGLILVKEFTKKNHGTFSFDSILGKGSIFKIELPKTL